MAIVGEIPSSFVLNQVSHRQQFYGSTNRDTQWHQYATSRTAWAKLASGVTLLETPVEKDGVNTKNTNIKYPQRFVLFNGTSQQTGNSLLQRSGVKDYGAYDTWDKDFGIVPMPGMESISVKAKNRGSIREATVKIKCWSKKQFEIIDKLYLRLGYNMLLEWGWSHYITSANSWKLTGKTLIDSKWFQSSEDSKRGPKYWLNAIQENRMIYKGNYDGFYGKVVNFNWSIDIDGSYDITLKLITHGDVVESLTFPVSMVPKSGVNEALVKRYILDTLFKDKALKKCFNSNFFKLSTTSPSTKPDANEIPWPVNCPFRYYGNGYLKNTQGKDQLSQHLFHLQFIGRGISNGRLFYFVDSIDQDEQKIIQKSDGHVVTAGDDDEIHGTLYGELSDQLNIWNKNYIDLINRHNIYQSGIVTNYQFPIGTNQNSAPYFRKEIESTGYGFSPDPPFTPNDTHKDIGSKESGVNFFSVLKKSDDITSKMSQTLGPVNGSHSRSSPSYQDAFVLYSQITDTETSGKEKLKYYFTMESNTYVRLQYILYYIEKYIIPEDKDLSEKIVNVGWKDQIICYLGADTYGNGFTLSSQPDKVTTPNPQWNPDDPRGKLGLESGNTSISWLSNSYGKCLFINADSGGNLEGYTAGSFNKNLMGDPEHFVHNCKTKDEDGKEKRFSFGLGKNLYFNVNFLNQILGSTNDSSKQPKIDIYSFLKKICDVANNSYGNIFNLEPIIDDSTNTLRIIDGTNHPYRKDVYALLGLDYVEPTSNELVQTYGYRRDSNGNTVTNFLRKFDIQTKIDKNLASMITIGATAQGGTTGVEATAFSRFNKGIENRFSKEYINPSKGSDDPKDPIDQFWVSTRNTGTRPGGLQYLSQMGLDVTTGWQPQFVNFVEFDSGKENKFKSSQSDILKYKENITFKDTKSGSPMVGFIPFSFNLELDGISGYKIYNALNVSISLLPPNYPDALEFIVSGVDHEIKDNDWTTKITTVACPKAAGKDVPRDIDLGKGTNYDSPEGIESGDINNNPPTQPGGGNVATNPPPNGVGGDQLKRREAMLKSYKHIFTNFTDTGAMCSQFTFNLAMNYARFLKGNTTGWESSGPKKIASEGHARQVGPPYNPRSSNNWTKRLVALGYTLNEVVPFGGSRSQVQLAMKNYNWEYGDVAIYWGNPWIHPDYEKYWRTYGHACIYVGDINDGVKSTFTYKYKKDGVYRFRQKTTTGTGWASSVRNNYGYRNDGFVYRTKSAPSWQFLILKAPGTAAQVPLTKYSKP